MAGRKRRLTDAGIAKLASAAHEYTVWDSRHAGLGVRVRPSGHRSFVYLCRDGDRSRRRTIGSVTLMAVGEARRRCRALEVEAATGEPERQAAPTFLEFVEGSGRACTAQWKPSTRKTMRHMLSAQLLPAFGSVRLDRITRVAVNQWFDGYSHKAPGGANQTLKLFRRFLNHAVECGIIRSNPAHGIRPNPRPKLTRFLSREEIGRLHAALDARAAARTTFEPQADIIRLLLFTGCRKTEIMTLRWQDVGDDVLRLADSKTGPRTVPLNAPARAVLERQRRGEGEFVFPSPRNPQLPRSGELWLWYAVRKEAGLDDVRLHDLRHSYASQAVLQGIPLPAVARLLGHRHPRMTLRYAHVGDRETQAAAERIGTEIARLLKAP